MARKRQAGRAGGATAGDDDSDSGSQAEEVDDELLDSDPEVQEEQLRKLNEHRGRPAKVRNLPSTAIVECPARMCSLMTFAESQRATSKDICQRPRWQAHTRRDKAQVGTWHQTAEAVVNSNRWRLLLLSIQQRDVL